MSLINTTSKKYGSLFSFLHLALQTVSSFALTSLFIRVLGANDYGLYQMIYSVASYILIIDLGISSTMVRFTTEFRVKKDVSGEENFAFHMLIILFALILFVAGVSVLGWKNLGYIYPSLNKDELYIGREMFAWMVFQIGLTIVSHYFQGIILSFEKFTLIKIISMIQIIEYSIISLILLGFHFGVLSIVYANTVAILFFTICVIGYVFIVLKYKIKFHGIDMEMMIPAFTLMLAMLLQSIISYVSTSLDKTLLGIFSSKESVTVYSVAATIVTLYNALPSVISGLYLPKITRAVVSGENEKHLTDNVIFAGRLQLMICLYVLLGFILIGKQFILIWTGEETLDAWTYAIIIMVPNTIPLIQNVTLSILDAKNKRLFRSVALGLMVIVNVLATIVLIDKIGPIGAPLGTAISYLIGHIFIMNWYYAKKIHLEIKRMFASIFNRIALAGALSFICCSFLHIIPGCSLLFFLIKGLIFTIIYCLFMFYIGMNKYEKDMVVHIVQR